MNLSDERPTVFTLQERILRYWTRRAEGFGDVRRKELSGDDRNRWSREILPWLPSAPEGEPLRALDIGTGAGFFAVLLAQQGLRVTAIDISDAMLEQAARLADEQGCAVDFQRMDATRLLFPDASLDVIVARNVLWTLTDPEAAYAEWRRVLRPGGVLLNFDADYGGVDFTELARLHGRHAHADINAAMLEECEEIRRALPLSSRQRPRWDVEALRRAGFARACCDEELSGRIYPHDDTAAYNPVPLFALRAVR